MGTTVILVRHAEKTQQKVDPDLSEEGKSRALKLAQMLAKSNIEGLFATQFKRTQQTLEPLAALIDEKIEVISAFETAALVRKILRSYRGKTVVVASHSDRVTEIIEGLGGQAIGYLPESEYDNLYIVTILGDTGAKVIRLKY
jgi:broad specificity phosphatase PhoE